MSTRQKQANRTDVPGPETKPHQKRKKNQSITK
jgi:hypothetical protein